MKERALAHFWSLGPPGEWLTQEGERVRVAFQGVSNDDRGPDFVNAIIVGEGGQRVKGDVEVHLLASGFRAHGHHLDPYYNNVILHLVLKDDVGAPTQLESGVRVPVLALGDGGRLFEGQSLLLKREPCRGAAQNLGIDEVLKVLERAGHARFHKKGRPFARALARNFSDQVLYQGIMEALGYSRNQQAFQKLAQKLPWPIIKELGLKAKEGERGLVLQALFLGSAGLLPSQHHWPAPKDALANRPPEGAKAPIVTTKGDSTEKMEAFWASASLGSALDEKDWRFFRVRPRNSPLMRLAGAAHLLAPYLEDGLVQGLIEPLEEGSVPEAIASLERRLTVRGEGFPTACGSFGKGGGATLVGEARAREMAVNIVLPFARAWAGRNSMERLSRRALEIYRGYPRLADNRITRHMAEKLGFSQAETKITARHQQGMHHLYQKFCLRGDCGPCPFSSPAVAR